MPLDVVFRHVALSVSDLDRSIAFYRDLFGYTVSLVLDFPSERRLGTLVGMPDASARIAHLTLGEAVLELLEYRVPRGRPIPADRTQADNGLSHVAFDSKDIHSDCEALRRRGIRFYSDIIELRPGVFSVYFYGPDGETCELRQVAA
jgi:glyoxylase I family protein